MYFIGTLLVAAVLGIIPAKIAQSKGYDFTLWWFYGWMLFIVAIVHALVLPDKNEQKKVGNSFSGSSADELLKYKKLLDDEIITQEEFDEKKKQLLNL